MKHIIPYLAKWKYEALLVALIQHLFVGILLTDMNFYIKVVWPINMLILGVASIGIFTEKERWKRIVKNILFVIVVIFPISVPFFGTSSNFMVTLSVSYTLFFGFIFWEVIKFLVRPSYINADIISASACGYLLLIEISTFLVQFTIYHNPNAFKGISTLSPADTYIDIVYLCTITLTSIGFGDITPNAPNTKLIISLLGIVGQFYSVVLVGILISKFTSKTTT